MEGLRELALFAGAGGGILGGKILGWRTVCAVECDAYASQVLIQRQNDGSLELFPVWSDVRTFDGNPWRGIVDVVSGGFPCQDISQAGRGAGIAGERSGLWSEMARIIREVRPRYVFVENVPAITYRGLGVVLGDLSELGFDAEWGVVSAAGVGAPIPRARMWIVASPNIQRRCGMEEKQTRRLPNINCKNIEPWGKIPSDLWLYLRGTLPDPISGFVRNDDGLAAGMDRLKAIGNGQVPLQAATAWRILSERLEGGR